MVGPHRADLQLIYKGTPASDILSQGQLKLLSYDLHLIQGMILQEQQDISPIYLIDDLGSELDNDNIQRVLAFLSHINAQHIISCINCPQNVAQACMFHVEHGNIMANPKQ